MSFRVGVEKMIRARIILVDAFFYEPQAEDTGIEIEIFLRRPSDGRDVVDSADGFHKI